MMGMSVTCRNCGGSGLIAAIFVSFPDETRVPTSTTCVSCNGQGAIELPKPDREPER